MSFAKKGCVENFIDNQIQIIRILPNLQKTYDMKFWTHLFQFYILSLISKNIFKFELINKLAKWNHPDV